jgi:hypothetical protein
MITMPRPEYVTHTPVVNPIVTYTIPPIVTDIEYNAMYDLTQGKLSWNGSSVAGEGYAPKITIENKSYYIVSFYTLNHIILCEGNIDNNSAGTTIATNKIDVHLLLKETTSNSSLWVWTAKLALNGTLNKTDSGYVLYNWNISSLSLALPSTNIEASTVNVILPPYDGNGADILDPNGGNSYYYSTPFRVQGHNDFVALRFMSGGYTLEF